MKKLFFAALLAVMLTVGAVAGLAASPKSEATITFSLNTATCQLTITSTKDISNYTVNGVKTEGVTTTTVTISVANGDVITVKSGTSTATYTVAGCALVPPGDDHDHDGDGGSDGPHDGHDHNGDGQHTVDDHH